MPNSSLESWRQTPTTKAAIFAADLPYRPPKNPVGAFVWRWRIWLETTIGLSVLEPWEKAVMLMILYALFTLIFTGLYKYLPQQLATAQQRMTYYLFGSEMDQSISVPRLVAGLVGMNTTRDQFISSSGAY